MPPDATSILATPPAAPAAAPTTTTAPPSAPPPASTTTASPQATTTTTTTTAPADWLVGFDQDVREAITAKGYKSAAEVGRGWLAASKLIGVDPSQVIKLPGKDADAAAWDAVYAKLGRPEKSDGYSLPEPLKDDPLAGAFRDVAHKSGLTAKQFEATLGWYTAEASKVAEQQARQAEQAQEKRLSALQAKVGPDKWPGYLEEARRAARTLLPESYTDAVTGETLTRDQISTKLADALGVDLAVSLMSSIAKFTIAEDSTERGRSGVGAGMSKEAATARRNELRNDRAWLKRWTEGDVEARKEMAKLDQIIAGGA